MVFREGEKMTVKLVGALLVLIGCGGYGYMIAASHRTEVTYLRAYMHALDIMECELQYRLTPLPELCEIASTVCSGALCRMFVLLHKELDNQLSPNVEICVNNVLNLVKLPQRTKEVVNLLGRSLGRFDTEGQIKGLHYVKAETKRILDALIQNQEARLRSYQTLGLCAGAALVILFI